MKITRHDIGPELWLEDDETAAFGNNLLDLHDSNGGLAFIDLDEIPELVNVLMAIYVRYQKGERGTK